jgi:hypothetical protein
MATITYTIISGLAPFTAELSPSLIPINIHTEIGTYEFTFVPNGNYSLIITDSNNCKYTQQLTVDPFITTTTTTQIPEDSIIVGQTNDEYLIFDIDTTNRNDHYLGYPDENTSTLFLWFKTFDGNPLTTSKLINYSIIATSGSTFKYGDISDQTHVIVSENAIGFASTISGQIVLKEGFIESMFQYTYIKNPIIPDYQIELSSSISWLDPNIQLTDGTNQYGVTYVDNDNIIMKF